VTTIERLQTIAPLLVAVLLGLGVLLFALSMLMFRRSRRNAYWRQRRAAGQAGFRFLVWSLIMSVAGVMLCTTTTFAAWLAFPDGIPTAVVVAPSLTATLEPSATATQTLSPTETLSATLPMPSAETAPFARVTETLNPTVLLLTATPTLSPTPTFTLTPTVTATLTFTATATPTETLTPSPTQTFTPSATPTPTFTFTPTATPTETATPTPTFTFTPSATPSPTLIPLALLSAPVLESSVTPSGRARLTITALGTRLSATGQIVNAQQPFKAPIARVYFAVRAENLQSGVLWRRELLHNGAVVQAASYLWGLRAQGQMVFFFGQAEGFPAGDYEIRLYIGASETAAARAAFRIE